MNKWLNRIENTFISMSMLLAALIVFFNVGFRAFGKGYPWSDELVRYLLIWMTFVGISVCLRTGNHVGITILLDYLKGTPKKMVSLFNNMVIFIFSLTLLWLGFKIVQFSAGTSQLTPALRVPMYVVYLTLPLAGLLTAIRSLQIIISLITGKATDPDIDEKTTLHHL